MSPVVIVVARHGRGPRQRRWRFWFSSPVIALPTSVGLWRRVGGRGQPCTPRWPVVRLEYRSSISTMAPWRGMRGAANIARHGGVASLGGSDCARGCFPYCSRKLPQSSMSLYVDPRHRLDDPDCASSSDRAAARQNGSIDPLPTFKVDAMNGREAQKAVFASSVGTHKVPRRSVRFIFFAISGSGVRAFECALELRARLLCPWSP